MIHQLKLVLAVNGRHTMAILKAHVVLKKTRHVQQHRFLGDHQGVGRLFDRRYQGNLFFIFCRTSLFCMLDLFL
jgi:hypothetical protein